MPSTIPSTSAAPPGIIKPGKASISAALLIGTTGSKYHTTDLEAAPAVTRMSKSAGKLLLSESALPGGRSSQTA